MLDYPSTNQSPLIDRETTDKTLKLLVFKVGTLTVALSVDFVKKILKKTEIHGSGTTEMGIAHIDNQEITVIDLHKRLFKVSQPLNQQANSFLILAKNTIDEIFGILVTETPTLIDLPLSQIRVLPDSYRRGDTLEIATHVTRIEEKEVLVTVFILDVDKLVPPIPLGDFVF